mmetsp:Transcript_18189/g.25633  ORF Transcript_18189/g.25633 Transcript_18189/m.25633 type:complete len:688 (+) Transcript_18189:84-2147(+)
MQHLAMTLHVTTRVPLIRSSPGRFESRIFHNEPIRRQFVTRFNHLEINGKQAYQSRLCTRNTKSNFFFGSDYASKSTITLKESFPSRGSTASFQSRYLSCLGDEKNFQLNASDSVEVSVPSMSKGSSVHDKKGTVSDRSLRQWQQKVRKRAVVALCMSLAHDMKISKTQSERSFSTAGGDGSENESKKKSVGVNDNNSKEEGIGDGSKPANPVTEKDFADYLTRKMSLEEGIPPPVQPPSSTTSSSDWITNLSPEQIRRSPIQDNYSELYRTIQRKQESKRENARAKTAANVRRALTGNLVICAAKLGAWVSSGSSSMLSEFVHSVVDCGNQGLLLLGLRDSRNVADKSHPYGYGKSIYFWALVSALGTFFLGAGLSMTHAVGELIHPSVSDITWEVWTVLGISLAVDGYVLGKTVAGIRESMPENMSFWSHVQKIRDPATLAVLLEDGAACLGVVIASGGIGATQMTGLPVFDGIAGVAISCLLGTMGLALVKINHRFLLGQAVDHDITEGIKQILLNRRSIDNVYSVQSQWTGPETFSYKAEVDFDGTFLAAKLMPRYQSEFLEVRDTLDQELRVLLSWYAEDIMRTVEREVRHIEAEIRREYPGAEFIELEPMSKDADRFAVDDALQAQLRRIELDRLNRYLKSLYPVKGDGRSPSPKVPEKSEKSNYNSSDKSQIDEKWKPKR